MYVLVRVCEYVHIIYVIVLGLGFQLTQLSVLWFAHCFHYRHILATYTNYVPD